ncbi:MAG: ROK family protein [Anaerolineae bacterium]
MRLSSGERWAEEVIEQAHQQLAISLSAAYNLLDLEVAVLGGGAVLDVFPNLDRLQQLLEELVYPEIRPITLKKSSLGSEAMLVGAALLAFDTGQ